MLKKDLPERLVTLSVHFHRKRYSEIFIILMLHLIMCRFLIKHYINIHGQKNVTKFFFFQITFFTFRREQNEYQLQTAQFNRKPNGFKPRERIEASLPLNISIDLPMKDDKLRQNYKIIFITFFEDR